jgi:hypothetical protein
LGDVGYEHAAASGWKDVGFGALSTSPHGLVSFAFSGLVESIREG